MTNAQLCSDAFEDIAVNGFKSNKVIFFFLPCVSPAELTNRARRELHKAARRFLEISSRLFLQSLDGERRRKRGRDVILLPSTPHRDIYSLDALLENKTNPQGNYSFPQPIAEVRF